MQDVSVRSPASQLVPSIIASLYVLHDLVQMHKRVLVLLNQLLHAGGRVLLLRHKPIKIDIACIALPGPSPRF